MNDCSVEDDDVRCRREEAVRLRRYPRATQHDYLHLRCLLRDLRGAIRTYAPSEPDVLDVYCGSRPYDDLLPEGAHIVGLDVADEFGVADVISTEFLPFESATFDLVICTQAFYYVPEPELAVKEIWRVLRPGGVVLITVPHVQEYDRSITEWRFTGPQLRRLFDGWDHVTVIESGGRVVALATIIGRVALDLERFLAPRCYPRRAAAWVRGSVMLVVNGVASVFERVDAVVAKPGFALPSSLVLGARKAGGGPPSPPSGARVGATPARPCAP